MRSKRKTIKKQEKVIVFNDVFFIEPHGQKILKYYKKSKHKIIPVGIS